MFTSSATAPTMDWLKAAVFAVVLSFAVLVVPATTPALADNTAKCGAKGETPCPIGVKAAFIAKAQTKCPKGSFFDAASFSCWSCPSGFNKTGAPAKSGQACLKKPRTDYADADKDGKIKFSKKTIRRIKNGNFGKICKGNSYYDKKGGKYGACWECPNGFVRNITSSAKGNRACVRVSGLSRKAATKVSGFNPCRKGFFDPRAGGQCWSCPAGYLRGPTKVNSKSACIIQAANVCDKGNILVYSKCQKKNACGQLGQRPCLVVERIPSCKKGLFEDVLNNKCSNAAAVMCSTMMRVLKTAQKGEKKLSKKQQQFEKKAAKASTVALKAVLGKKGHKKLIGGISSATKTLNKAKSRAARETQKAVNPALKAMSPASKQIVMGMNGLVNAKDKLLSLAMSKKFCLMTPKDRFAAMQKTMGVQFKSFDLEKASLDRSLFDGLLIKSAHAASSKKRGMFGLGISASFTGIPELAKFLLFSKYTGGGGGALDPGVGLAWSYYMVTDGKKTIQRMGIGPIAVSAKGFEVTPFFSILNARSPQSVGGGGFGIGVGVGVEHMLDQFKKTGKKVGEAIGNTVGGQLAFTLLYNNTFNYEGMEIGLKGRLQRGQTFSGGDTEKFEASGDMGWAYDFPLR